MTTKNALLLFLLACIALGSGYFFHKQNLGNHSSQTDTLFTIPLSNLKKETTTLAQYKNKWLIINFWATWCAPCREEIPELNEFYKNNDVQLIGLAIDEMIDVIKFQNEVPINYPSYVANDIEGVTLAKNLGNARGVLPFTVIVQPNGLINKTFYGKVNIDDLNQALSDKSL